MIYLTENANAKLQQNLNKQPSSSGIKIGIKKSGCSGYSYVLEYVDATSSLDLSQYHVDGIDIYIDPKHIPFLKGVTLDFQKKGLNELFEFINPNESARCGCGESFTL